MERREAWLAAGLCLCAASCTAQAPGAPGPWGEKDTIYSVRIRVERK